MPGRIHELRCSLAWRHSTFDGLGRVVREETEYPEAGTGIGGAFRTFTYDALGRKPKSRCGRTRA